MHTQILIIGGGLSGLHTAFELEKLGFDYLLVEARDRLGGRILSPAFPDDSADAVHFDLGPTWFWPGQRRMEQLVLELGLRSRIFEQPSQGDALLEVDLQTVRRGDFGASMAGSYRVEGGIGRITRELVSRIPEVRIRRSSRVDRIDQLDQGLEAKVTDSAGGRATVSCERVVIALPPRIALEHIELNPALPGERRQELGRIATWMAAQGKLVAIYDSPIWREAGLSGDAMSYVGPMGEIHDASPSSGGPHALFGFFAVPASVRRQSEALKKACIHQLGRLFGDAVRSPREILMKDWAFDPLTSTDADLQGPAVHSLIGLDETMEPGWDGRLIWSGSETASPDQRHNGYLEGALEASRRTVELLRR